VSEAEIRTITPDELDPWIRAVESSFGWVPTPDHVELEHMVAQPDRYLAAFEDGRIVGGNASIPIDLTVPGGRRLTVCAVNGVGVAPGATRRGISTSLMRRQLENTRERGEPIAILHASEAAIYGRYDFGIVTRDAQLDVDAVNAAFVRGFDRRGNVRLVDREEGLATYTAARAAGGNRPGWVGPAERHAPWLIRDVELDDEFDAEKEPLFFAAHEVDGERDGVAVYRIKHSWPESRPQNKAVVYDLVGATPRAHAELWRFILDLDLVATVGIWSVPVDEPLFRLVREPRALRMRIVDGVHLALVDLPAALEGRAYAADGRIRFGIRDAFCDWNDGTWELAVDAGAATCRRTDDEPDISLSSTDLASTYLGDVTFADLAAALRLHGDATAVARADAITASMPVPWCWLPI
jgi:predicted acetyltransferase